MLLVCWGFPQWTVGVVSPQLLAVICAYVLKDSLVSAFTGEMLKGAPPGDSTVLLGGLYAYIVNDRGT